MDQQTLLVIMAVFVAVSAIALSIQAGLLFGIYKSSRSMERNAQRLLPKIEALVETSKIAIDDGRRQVAEISIRTTDILDLTKTQLARVDELMEDVTDRARIQMDRAELVLDDTMSRAQETVALVHGGIMKPLRQIQGIAAGLQAALNFLLRGRNGANPGAVHVDEEMFI
jgi:hypothetical protein